MIVNQLTFNKHKSITLLKSLIIQGKREYQEIVGLFNSVG